MLLGIVQNDDNNQLCLQSSRSHPNKRSQAAMTTAIQGRQKALSKSFPPTRIK